ncbi:hypothetical protein BBOMB_0184 [Bifidobacterium bombi DSM 19703]|uniref:Uncharacterized protein n=2 Tax=Bifidobacterium bombi TaxID=471511 RepID=A0A080N1X0_9BIFI|nr:hypothetical protein BBOMB_0184 [Bifidobacterium bombi DSM 19703]
MTMRKRDSVKLWLNIYGAAEFGGAGEYLGTRCCVVFLGYQSLCLAVLAGAFGTQWAFDAGGVAPAVLVQFGLNPIESLAASLGAAGMLA